MAKATASRAPERAAQTPQRIFANGIGSIQKEKLYLWTTVTFLAIADILPAASPNLPVENPALWLDAENRESITCDASGRVSEWRDLGPRQNSARQEEETHRPILGPTALDGEPGLIFSGNEWLVTPLKPHGIEASDQISIFVVFRTAQEHPLRLMGLLGNGGLNRTSPGMILGVNDSDIVKWNNSVAFAVHDGIQPLVAAANTGDPRKLGLARQVTPQFPMLLCVVLKREDSPLIRLQGRAIDTKIAAVPATPGINPVSCLAIGAGNRSGSHAFAGTIAEMLIYDRALSARELAQVETWLISRHNIKRPSSIVLDPRVEPTTLTRRAQTITPDGTMLRLANGILYESKNGTKWTERFPVTGDPAFPNMPLKGGLLAVTPSGTLILVTYDRRPKGFIKLRGLNAKFNSGEAKSDVYTFRSVDGGKTWRDGQILQSEYCGALRDIKVTQNGTIVAALQAWDPHYERHVTVIHTSEDDGKTYGSSRLDNGIGRGLHDGFYEPTVVELGDGKLWLLGRTSLGVFWQARSIDSGKTWSKPESTAIEAGSYPGFLLRLKSGRIVLAWNRYYPDTYPGRDDLINIAGKSWYWGLQPSSRFNRELSIMFSEDDGKSWTAPTVVAEGSQDFAALSYPFLLERRPGEIYLWAGKLAIKIHEADFIQR